MYKLIDNLTIFVELLEKMGEGGINDTGVPTDSRQERCFPVSKIFFIRPLLHLLQ